MNAVFIILALLFIKHWYIDFVNQTDAEVKGKGIYGNYEGIQHSAKHGLATLWIFVAVTGWGYLPFAVTLGFLDFITHYHIDWTKMNYGNRDITTPEFWNHLGLDQLAHYLAYLAIVWLSVA